MHNPSHTLLLEMHSRVPRWCFCWFSKISPIHTIVHRSPTLVLDCFSRFVRSVHCQNSLFEVLLSNYVSLCCLKPIPALRPPAQFPHLLPTCLLRSLYQLILIVLCVFTHFVLACHSVRMFREVFNNCLTRLSFCQCGHTLENRMRIPSANGRLMSANALTYQMQNAKGTDWITTELQTMPLKPSSSFNISCKYEQWYQHAINDTEQQSSRNTFTYHCAEGHQTRCINEHEVNTIQIPAMH